MSTRIETMPPDAGARGQFAGDGDNAGDAAAFLDAVLAPNRSLPNVGYYALMLAVIGLAFVAGLFYVRMGAWPVLGFFGLDIFLIWLAFRVSYRQGRLRERVRVTRDRIDVERRHPTGHVQRWRMATLWTQVEIEDPVRHDSQVCVRHAGKTLILGAFLSPPERQDFAAALRGAIAAARAQGSGGAA